MHKHFELMLKDGKGTDVTFSVDGQLFRAHRYVLASRSPVFDAELFGPMKQDATEHVQIDDMEPFVFESLLHFIYTDRIKLDKGQADKNVAMQHLLVAADRYGLDRLKTMCEADLCNGIDLHTVGTTLVLAEQHNCLHLKDACITFVASKDVLGDVLKTDGFKHFIESCPLFLCLLLLYSISQLLSFAMADASASSTKASSILSETSSSCYTQAITAAHNFEVINFSLLEGMGAGKVVSSRNFNVGGYDWKIDLYPDGCTTEKEGYVSAFLVIQGEKAAARAKFSFSLLGKDGQVKRQNTTYIFKTGDAYGWKEFMQKSDLQPLLRLNNDSFTIRCVLTVITDPLVEDVITIVVPQPNLLQDFAQMLKDGEGADVTFSVGDQLFPAHRCVLAARSAVFKAELFSPMKEKATKHIRIDDIEPSIFEALLHFIYTDSLPDDCGADKNVPMQHLLVAADRYGLDRLRLMCEVKMCNSIDAETVATTLALAEQHHCVQLKKACLRFVTSRGMLGAVMESNGFDHLAASCPLVLLEILDRLASLGI
ncbi:hypothetical protein PR202_gb14316 [Eleusine coracana subsp. coracana]|uniref:Uncharacterized protein n=1 Tax=Eleusine coracana subsp. coracana TaxID=191504 RepID=A0AAV5EV54_ELECO|nr:hypothetical protein PR202_gb14316 [Eleusine coracana subsp. coracana]